MNAPSPHPWISLRDALKRMAQPREPIENVWAGLSGRLSSGNVRTRAVIWHEDHFESARETRHDDEIPGSYWTYLNHHELKEVVGGLVILRGSSPEDNRPVAVEAHGLHLNAEDLYDLLGPHGKSGRRPGRPPGNWWSDFAEELTIYLYEGEFSAATPVAQVSKAVLDRMAERGCEAPDPQTVGPTVRRVLDRL
jgi:hypothetical protein